VFETADQPKSKIMNSLRLFPALLLACAGSGACAAEPGILPYRPSVSSPAQLPAPGQLEFEIGGLGTESDDGRRVSLPILFKLAFTEEWGVLLGGESFVSAQDGAGRRVRGVGDLSVVLKRAFAIKEGLALGLEFGAKLPTAKETIGSGKADYTVNTIFSQDIGAIRLDANANVTRLGSHEAGAGRTQTGLSASFSTALADKWSGVAELSGTRRNHVPATAQLLVGTSYSPSNRMTLDFGLARGLTSASTTWSVFGGIVVPVGQLW
jgi:hypothetical protein